MYTGVHVSLRLFIGGLSLLNLSYCRRILELLLWFFSFSLILPHFKENEWAERTGLYFCCLLASITMFETYWTFFFCSVDNTLKLQLSGGSTRLHEIWSVPCKYLPSYITAKLLIFYMFLLDSFLSDCIVVFNMYFMIDYFKSCILWLRYQSSLMGPMASV